MNLIQQCEKVIQEWEKLHSFWRNVNRCNMIRSLIPRNAFHLIRLDLMYLRSKFLTTQPADDRSLRQKHLDLLCSDRENSSPYFDVVRSDPVDHFHALGEHLGREFPDFNWLALEDVTRLRLDQMPRIGVRSLLKILGLLSPLVPILGGYGVFEINIPPLDMTNDWIVGALVAFAYLLVILLSVFVIAYRARNRLRKTIGILGYMAVRARAGEMPAART